MELLKIVVIKSHCTVYAKFEFRGVTRGRFIRGRGFAGGGVLCAIFW